MSALYPFVSSPVETPAGSAQPHGISTSSQSEEVYPEQIEGLDANGRNGFWI